MKRPRRSGVTVLRHGGFTRFVICRCMATLGGQMLAVAVGWQVYALTRDPLALGLVGLSEFLPFISLVLVGGHIADRIDRRRVLTAAWSVEVLCIAALLWMALTGAHLVWPYYIAIGVFGGTRAFWSPTMQALVPLLVPAEDFPRAIAVNSSLFQAAIILGPALGGALFLLGAGTVFGCCLALYLAAVLLSLTIGVHAPARPATPATHAAHAARAVAGPAQQATGSAFFEGLRYVLQRRRVLGVISLDLFALLPVFASDILRVGPAGLGLLRTAPAVGSGLMALLLSWRPIERYGGAVMFGGVALFGLATLVFGASRSFPLSLAALVLAGSGDMCSVYVRGILVQTNTPDAIRGRVSAISSMFIGTSNQLGGFESGLTAKWFGTVPAVLLGGALTLVVVATWMGLFPELRRLDRMR